MSAEIVIIIILLAIVLVILAMLVSDRIRASQRWKEQGDALSKTVGERIADTTKVFGEVKESLGKLTQRAEQIQEVGKDVSSLQELLRAPKFRGGFGELLLERLLADILPKDNYKIQHRFENGETVDAVIRVGGKLVPIDAKFPLAGFKGIVAVESEEEQESLRKEFTRNIKKHIEDVSKYILPDEGTFDFALMYIPAENIYYETIIRGTGEGDIFSYSLNKKVIPVSPNSFYAYLQVIVQGLKGLHFEKEAGEILSYVKRLQGDFGDFQHDYGVVGEHIRHAANKYDEASRKLTRFGDKLQLTGATPAERLPEGDAETHNEGEFANE